MAGGNGSHEFEDAILVGVGIALALALILYAGAWLSAALFGPHTPAFDLVAPLAALAHFGRPALAWPRSVRRDVPGAGAYWATTFGLLAALTAVGTTTTAWWIRRNKSRKPGRETLVSRDELASARGLVAIRKQAERLRDGGAS